MVGIDDMRMDATKKQQKAHGKYGRRTRRMEPLAQCI